MEPFGNISIQFFKDLQAAHDQGDDPYEMKENLKAVAKGWGLTIPQELG